MSISLAPPLHTTVEAQPKRPYFDSQHPLAEVAAGHCRQHSTDRPLVGGRIACGSCWELTIRDDEKFAIEHELPRELDTEPEYIDHVAVQQTLNGQKVPLTRNERAEVNRLRLARKASPARSTPSLQLVA